MTDAGKVRIRRGKEGARPSGTPRRHKKDPNRRKFTGADHAMVFHMANSGVGFDRIADAVGVTMDRLYESFWNELHDARRVAGKKPLLFTEEKRAHVRLCAAAGIPIEKVAEAFQVDYLSFARHFGREWNSAPVDLLARVAQALIKNALSGDGPSQRFIMERRGFGAWSEQVKHDHQIAFGDDSTDVAFDLADVSDDELEAMRGFVAKQIAPKKQLLTVEHGEHEVGGSSSEGTRSDQDEVRSAKEAAASDREGAEP